MVSGGVLGENCSTWISLGHNIHVEQEVMFQACWSKVNKQVPPLGTYMILN